MALFHFKFDLVLRQRQMEEDRCQRELAKVLRQRMIFQTQLRQMQETITTSKRGLASGLIGRVDLAQVASFARYSGQVAQRAQQLVLRLATLEKQIEQARQQLLRATRARQALELLRQRQYDRWRLEQERRERIELDEIAAQQFLRQGALGMPA